MSIRLTAASVELVLDGFLSNILAIHLSRSIAHKITRPLLPCPREDGKPAVVTDNRFTIDGT
jgi:hypothetical protein